MTKKRLVGGAAAVLAAALVAASALASGQAPSPAAKATGRTYFVATDGDDSCDGLAPVRGRGRRGPFRTPARAAQIVVAGDTVQIRGGVYTGYGGSWGYTRGGTEARPITIMSYPGETPVIDGQDRRLPEGPYTPLMQIYGDWINVAGLEFRNGSYAGLNIAGDHCLVTGVLSHHNLGSGIFASGAFDTIADCRVHDNSLVNERGVMKIGWGFGISLCAGARDGVVKGCTSWNNWGEGISIASGYSCTIEDCVSYDNFTTNIYICQSVGGVCRRNLSYYTPGNPLQAFVSSQNSIIVGDEGRPPASAGNLIVNNLCLGGDRCLLVGGDEFEGTLIAHNTFANAFGRLGWSEAACVYFTAGSSEGGRFLNNVVLQDGRVPISHLEARGIAFGPNAWSKRPQRGCRGRGDVIGDPRLLRAGPERPGALTADWFRPSFRSPVRERAVPLDKVPDDAAGRPRGQAPDLGALEIVKRSSEPGQRRRQT